MEGIPVLIQFTFLKKHLLESYQPNPNQYGRTIPPYFQHWDKVWLASNNIKTKTPTKKLSERWLGPFEVLKKIGSHADHLRLPHKWKSVHPVFHVSLLEPFKQSTIPNQHQFTPPPVLVE
ncbi:hypothetical protein O181_020931 [Austropuccinia psidii MF-1]|uniref:Tf2-1-like SH3-like domain-containing protein n=1 Tax=Austropuccinia psidii MF-1 TaxID=1389203 RepID=A0A9Q3CA00_9BASI|nr:hypothetical protein [Austropuccinia psidii MF-1]